MAVISFATAINEDDNTASLALAMDVAGYFELENAKAREIAKQVGTAVSKWRDEAARVEIVRDEVLQLENGGAERIEVRPFDTLLMSFAEATEAGVIIRRLTAYEADDVVVDELTYHEALSAVAIRGGIAGNVVIDVGGAALQSPERAGIQAIGPSRSHSTSVM